MLYLLALINVVLLTTYWLCLLQKKLAASENSLGDSLALQTWEFQPAWLVPKEEDRGAWWIRETLEWAEQSWLSLLAEVASWCAVGGRCRVFNTCVWNVPLVWAHATAPTNLNTADIKINKEKTKWTNHPLENTGLLDNELSLPLSDTPRQSLRNAILSLNAFQLQPHSARPQWVNKHPETRG